MAMAKNVEVSADPTLAQARTWLSRAHTRARHGDFAKAFDYLEVGLETIGDRYIAGAGAIDATEQKRWAAESRAASGFLAEGVAQLIDILALRIRLYVAKSIS